MIPKQAQIAPVSDAMLELTMAVLDIRTYPDEVLRKKTRPVENPLEGEIQQLIDDMVETMVAAPGVGLAANQVGVSKRLCVIDITAGKESGNLHVLINPEIVDKQGSEVCEEGCLSVPGYYAQVKRAATVVVRYLDRNGIEKELEADELLARAVQHEVDHLNGMLFVDRLGPVRREIFRKKYRKALAEASF